MIDRSSYRGFKGSAVAKYRFSEAQRHAVYTVHGERCYMCRAVLDMKTMEVDHVIPEALRDKAERLAEVLASLGRPADFNLDSYPNWLPSCRSCNGTKHDRIFDPAPIVVLQLQQAADRVAEAEKIEKRLISDKEVFAALSVFKRVSENGELSEAVLVELWPLVAFHQRTRQPERVQEPIRLTPKVTIPLHQVLSDDGWIRTVRGPYGVGGGPSNHVYGSRTGCPICGHQYFNGARCISCGNMDDGD